MLFNILTVHLCWYLRASFFVGEILQTVIHPGKVFTLYARYKMLYKNIYNYTYTYCQRIMQSPTAWCILHTVWSYGNVTRNFRYVYYSYRRNRNMSFIHCYVWRTLQRKTTRIIHVNTMQKTGYRSWLHQTSKIHAWYMVYYIYVFSFAM